ncbi:MAG TPA: WbqC family protein [bacterium]|nr:WbqC family protein [bacterium]
MIAAIHQPHYLPWLRYMHKLGSCDVFVLLDDVQFTKHGWQNRNKIKGPNGPLLLTVPVRDATFRPIDEVEINPDAVWREKHWKSILLSYGKAPYFRRFRDAFEHIYAANWENLASLNLRILAELVRSFGIHTRVVRSSELGVPGQSTERLVNLCRRLDASHYLTGTFAAGNHLDVEAFAASGITLSVQAWKAPVYRQQFPGQGFISDLSAVDLLFNEGPRSLDIIMNSGDRDQTPAVSLGPSLV